jgi:hypothetical protein
LVSERKTAAWAEGGIVKAVWIDREVEVNSLKTLLRGKMHWWLRGMNKKGGLASRTI